MKFSLRTFGRHLLGALASATLQAWVMVLCVACALSLLRVGQIAWHWPEGLEVSLADLWSVVFQGARFDLKVCAAAAILLWPVLIIVPARWHSWLTGTVTLLFVTASLVNLHYFGFYKTPIDPVVFGFFEDDTKAILQTIWSDFPVTLTLSVLAAASWGAMAARKAAYDRLSLRLNRGIGDRLIPVWLTLLGVLCALFLLALTTKGTLRAMALGRQNVSVTTSQFLNDMVPNGVIALKFAWDGRKASQNFSDPLLGLKQLGYDSPMAAARVLGIEASDNKALRASLFAKGGEAPSAAGKPHKNLLFFLMESWSAEPFRYQAKDFDVLGRLAPTLAQACHFSNFDSAQPGTHPSLEAILFSTPITPLTLGPQGKRPIPWSVPLILKQAGYHTLFVTSTRSGWRDLDRVLRTQGFDEVVDANNLKAAYPEATLGIWGVWDSYVFRYLSERLKKKEDKPLFVFVLTATNHPPYDLPPEYQRIERNQAKWGGERNADTLWLNIDSYHYATDLLGGLVQEVRSGPQHANTVMAATGDHNVRSFGLYATPERRHLVSQVPFVIWGDGIDCGPQRQLPASHRDMFPTLLPLLGINSGFVKTGRNLLLDPAKQANPALNAPFSMNYYGTARNARGSWTLGDPASFVCSPGPAGADCRFDAQQDAWARAQLGLLDWNVRATLRH
ncbi:LTA synthase family protein [Rhodoferax sp.]|uniref:LTA synthase family protein n=1 Tax=Rhodoferax sp. TaxID=50421 RepID=UPI0027303CAB|nr:LTA synthase family protein [Rhodoferax sp.]MDP1655368.1 LTA synthase family protein [Hylemonella sp.]MDP1943508.1 LTA synthase family protein [Rhodoferax sp.]